MSGTKPLNPVHISESGRVAVVEECVLCGEEHRHGAADSALAAGERSSRGAHCAGRHTEYDLVLAEDADPPEHWRQQFEEVVET